MPQLTGYDKFIQQALKYAFSLWGTAKTDQVTVRRTGDDGDFQKGYPRSGDRFVDNGDGTITDNATGLMWVKEPGAIGGVWGTPGSPTPMNWDLAIDRCLALNYAGHDDWRLPNIKELMTLVDFSTRNPAIDEDFFPDTQLGNYKSSTSYMSPVTNGWVVYANDGIVYNVSKAGSDYVRPVRLGFPKD